LISGAQNNRVALAIFGILVVLAPLLFGAVDRISQIGLTAILAAGLWFRPPVLPAVSRWLKWTFILVGAVLVVKEFAPAALFGGTEWRETLTRDFKIVFPGTHNPEPTRALDALLVCLVGVCWFVWVRTLAIENRTTLSWLLFVAALGVAAVSLATNNLFTDAIYGLRVTPGWAGYGPFPNKNHTASFLAMGALIGCGCFARGLARKSYVQAGFAAVILAIVLAALFATRSRGGLIVFFLGGFIYSACALLKVRNAKVLLISLFALVIAAALCMAFGAKLLARFDFGSEISANLRWNIWSNTIAMWKDTPFFGHGLGTFPQLFPLYERLSIENQYVLHPESSWLQWLVEVGGIILLMVAALFAFILARQVQNIFVSHRNFFLRIGALSAIAALLFHCIWDVPAHRWATAGFALAILALLWPFSADQHLIRCDKRAALTPAVVAFFWSLPFIFHQPIWSPSYVPQLVDRAQRLQATPEEINRALRYFPLNATLHQLAGLRQLAAGKPSPEVWRQFHIASRLKPNSWSVAAAQAMASRPYSPGMTLHFWTLAIERTTYRHAEVFRMALKETNDLPRAKQYWARFAENNPDLLLVFAQHLPEEEGRYYFNEWWFKRALSSDLRRHEVENFYQALTKLGSLDQLKTWIRTHRDLEARDYKHWAMALQYWQDHAGAWKLLSRWEKEPEFPGVQISTSPEQLEVRWLTDPQNFVTAQLLAELWFRKGDLEKSRRIILAAAAEKDAPVWFRRKAAYAKAADGRYGEAVTMLLH
jgi:O-antigen ligase